MSWRAVKWSHDIVGLSPTSKAVLNALCDRADENTLKAWPSIERLSVDTGLSERSVKRARVDLETKKLIRSWREKSDTGSWAHRCYLIVISANLAQAGLSRWSEKDEQNPGGATVSPRVAKVAEIGQGGPWRGDSLSPESGHSGPLTPTEPPVEQPNTQTASSKPSAALKKTGQKDSPKASTSPARLTAERLRRTWQQEAPEHPSYRFDTLVRLVEEQCAKIKRSPEVIEKAADKYWRQARQKTQPATWICEWLKHEEYRNHLPRMSEDELRRADDAAYLRAILGSLKGDAAAWSVEKLGPKLADPGGWAPARVLFDAWFQAADDRQAGAIENVFRRLLNSTPAHREFRDEIDRLDYALGRLKHRGEWGGRKDEDPRVAPHLYPRWLLHKWGIPLPNALEAAA